MPADFALLAADLRERVFAMGSGAPPHSRRLGAEVELIPVDAGTRLALPIRAEDGPASLLFLRRFSRTLGWIEESTVKGPRFLLPDGGVLGYEPGGQIEIATPPLPTATALLTALRAVVTPLRAAAREEGIDLLSLGIDPVTPIERVPLQICGARYRQMTEYLCTRGTAGVRMMRQTAAFQLSLDLEEEPLPRWRVLNAAAPYLTAIFSNSPLYVGAPTGHQSFRAHLWRELDPARTGIFPATDAEGEYLAFALRAPAMLQPNPAGEYVAFAELAARGEATLADWHAHLSTLFPEVRPRGHVEVRSLDAMDPRWYAAPVALLAGILYHRRSLRGAEELLGAPDAALLRRAGEAGLGDEKLAAPARDLFEIGLSGAAALGAEFLSPADLEVAREFFERYTRRGRSPADDLLAASIPPRSAVPATCAPLGGHGRSSLDIGVGGI